MSKGKRELITTSVNRTLYNIRWNSDAENISRDVFREQIAFYNLKEYKIRLGFADTEPRICSMQRGSTVETMGTIWAFTKCSSRRSKEVQRGLYKGQN